MTKKQIQIWKCRVCHKYFATKPEYAFNHLPLESLEVKKDQLKAEGLQVHKMESPPLRRCPPCDDELGTGGGGDRSYRKPVADEDPLHDNIAKAYEDL